MGISRQESGGQECFMRWKCINKQKLENIVHTVLKLFLSQMSGRAERSNYMSGVLMHKRY